MFRGYINIYKWPNLHNKCDALTQLALGDYYKPNQEFMRA